MSTGASPLVCLSFAGWLSHCLLSHASASCHILSGSRRMHPSSTPPLYSCQLVVASHLFAPPPPLDAPVPSNARLQCGRPRVGRRRRGPSNDDALPPGPHIIVGARRAVGNVAIIVNFVVVVARRHHHRRRRRHIPSRRCPSRRRRHHRCHPLLSSPVTPSPSSSPVALSPSTSLSRVAPPPSLLPLSSYPVGRRAAAIVVAIVVVSRRQSRRCHRHRCRRCRRHAIFVDVVIALRHRRRLRCRCRRRRTLPSSLGPLLLHLIVVSAPPCSRPSLPT